MTTTTAAATIKKIAIALIEDANLQANIDELTELASTANLEVALVFTQNRPSPDPATYMGSGKVKEIKQAMDSAEITTVIFNDELSPIQHANLTDRLDAEVLDRTNLILHIFSMHARTAEGKIQVELARLKYLLPRLRSIPGKLSRQGAGVLARGPGETKLETDKRYLREQIRRLKSELSEIEKQRDVTRTRREKSQIPLIALVGYTNAGKSTLFNKLTNSGVLAEDKLFATLDTTIRRTELAPNLYVLISDTVGFIKNLPHHLIESFKSTLEETRYADIVLNVCDVSNPLVSEHNEVTHKQLVELKVTGKIIDVYNKCDLVSDPLLCGCGKTKSNSNESGYKPELSKNFLENNSALLADANNNKNQTAAGFSVAPDEPFNQTSEELSEQKNINCSSNGINPDFLSVEPDKITNQSTEPRASQNNDSANSVQTAENIKFQSKPHEKGQLSKEFQSASNNNCDKPISDLSEVSQNLSAQKLQAEPTTMKTVYEQVSAKPKAEETTAQNETEQTYSLHKNNQTANHPTITPAENFSVNAKGVFPQKINFENQNSVFVSAVTGQGLEKLKQLLINEIRSRYSFTTISLPYSQMNRLDELLTISYDTNLTYHENGVSVKGHFAKKFLSKWSGFIIN